MLFPDVFCSSLLKIGQKYVKSLPVGRYILYLRSTGICPYNNMRFCYVIIGKMLYLYRKIVVFYTTKALENGLKYCINYLYNTKNHLMRGKAVFSNCEFITANGVISSGALPSTILLYHSQRLYLEISYFVTMPVKRILLAPAFNASLL